MADTTQPEARPKDAPVIREESVPSVTRPGDGIPHVGRPLDGSEYLDVVEEQQYGEQPPSPAERARQGEKT